MNKEINYPIKYTVLELKENGGYQAGYEDITQGFIVSKCYVIESSIIYNPDGSNVVTHKVVFPFKDIEEFKISLRNGSENIGTAQIPRYDGSGSIYPISIVPDLYDSYEEAKVAAEEKNKEHRYNLILNKESIGKFETSLEICNKFERLVLAATEDMDISKEVNTNKVNTLKPVK